jgi:hypothetical protein
MQGHLSFGRRGDAYRMYLALGLMTIAAGKGIRSAVGLILS